MLHLTALSRPNKPSDAPYDRPLRSERINDGNHASDKTKRTSEPRLGYSNRSFRERRCRNLRGAASTSGRRFHAVLEDQKLPLAHERTAFPGLPSAAG